MPKSGNAQERSKLIGKDGKDKFYKGKAYMSISAFQTLQEEIANQLESSRRRSTSNSQEKPPPLRTSRSFSFGGSHDSIGRHALYGTLPFVATFGMQHREHEIRDVLVVASQQVEGIEVTGKALQDVDVDEIIVTVPMILAAFVAILSQFLVGYNTGVMNAPEAVVFPGHSTAMWSLAVSAFAIGGPGGAILGGLLANKHGRRGAMLINNWIFMLGGLLMSLAPSAYWLVPARLIIGFASGVSSVVVPVYLGEIAPPTLRGTLGTCTQFAMVIGILVTDMIAFPLATVTRWRYLFGITPALCFVVVIASSFLLESPRWLLSRNENSVAARVVIKQLRGFRSDEEVESEVENYLFAATKHKSKRASAHSSGAMLDLLRDKDLHILVVSSIVLQMSQQLCGINAVFYYSTAFFEGIVDNPLQATTMVAFVNVLATYVALKMMDSTGRRTLILFSAGGMLISTIFLTAALLGYVYRSIALFAVMAFVSFFEIGLGPIPWLIVAEMFDAKYVATAMSMACIVNWGCNFLVGLCFPFMSQALGPWTFAPFGVALLLTYAFTYFYLPETYGRTVEEIQQLVVSKTLSTHDSSEWQIEVAEIGPSTKL